jgi:hypothetical protein
MKQYFYFLLFLCCALAGSAQVCYVNAAATGDNNGTSWQNAYLSLKTALQNTNSGDIWVAEGTYKPTSGTDRTATFGLKSGINLYGGFPSQGNPDWAQRDWTAHPTILSGDIGVEGDTSDNTYTILETLFGLSFDITFDGFEVTGGNADYSSAGLKVNASGDNNVIFTARNCYFHHNYSGYEAAAIGMSSSKLLVSNCIFQENYAQYEAGAIGVFSGDLLISNCVFEENYAGYSGGAVSFFAGPLVNVMCKNSIFRNNYAGYEGGVASVVGYSIWHNCIFQGNYADYNAAVFSQFGNGYLHAVNCTFTDNLTLGEGSIIEFFSSIGTGIFANCIFSENNGDQLIDIGSTGPTISVLHCLTDASDFGSGVTLDASTVLNTNPGFTGFGDLHLMPGSPCIDAGDNTQLPSSLTMDLDGYARIQGNIVDLGAYEYGGQSSTKDASDAAIKVFPNPTTDVIFVEMDGLSPFTARLVNSQGQTIRDWHSDMTDTFKMDVGDLPRGLYMLRLEIGNQMFTKEIVIQ